MAFDNWSEGGRSVGLVLLGFVLTALGACFTHHLDEQARREEHLLSQSETVFDSATAAFTRVGLTAFSVYVARQEGASDDSLRRLGNAFERAAFAMNVEGPRLNSLVCIYFGADQWREFKALYERLQPVEAEMAANLSASPSAVSNKALERLDSGIVQFSNNLAVRLRGMATGKEDAGRVKC